MRTHGSGIVHHVELNGLMVRRSDRSSRTMSKSTTNGGDGERTYFEQQRDLLVRDIGQVRVAYSVFTRIAD